MRPGCNHTQARVKMVGAAAAVSMQKKKKKTKKKVPEADAIVKAPTIEMLVR